MGEMSDDYEAWPTEWLSLSGRLARRQLPSQTNVARGYELMQSIKNNTSRASSEGVVPHSARPPLRDRLKAERDALEDALDVLAQRLARKSDQLAQLARWPDEDPFEDGDRLEFTKVFPNSDRAYTYLALKAGGFFYITGARSPQGVTWAEFVEWCGLGVETVWKIGGKGGRRKVIG